MPTPCSGCKKAKLEYRVSLDTGRCVRCTSSGRKCDLVATKADWAKLAAQKEKIRADLEEAQDRQNELLAEQNLLAARSLRLRKELDLQTRKERALWEREEASIAEFERLEAEAALAKGSGSGSGGSSEPALPESIAGFEMPAGWLEGLPEDYSFSQFLESGSPPVS